jgi:hypothetical protein
MRPCDEVAREVAGQAPEGTEHLLSERERRLASARPGDPLDEHAAGCRAVVTGLGCLEDQTLDGKLVSIVRQRSGGRPAYALVAVNRTSP